MSSSVVPANLTIHVGLIVNTKDGKSTNYRVIPFILNILLTVNINDYITNQISKVGRATLIAGQAQHKDVNTSKITGPDKFVPAVFFNPTDYTITAVTYNDDGSINPSSNAALKLVKLTKEISNPTAAGDGAEKILLVTTVLKYIYDTLKSEQKNLNLAAQQYIDANDRDKFIGDFKNLIDKVKKSVSFINLQDIDAISEVEYISVYPNNGDITIVASPETATDPESIKKLYTIFTVYLKAIEEDKLRSQLGGGFKIKKFRISKKSKRSKRSKKFRSRISKNIRKRKSKKRRIMKRRTKK